MKTFAVVALAVILAEIVFELFKCIRFRMAVNNVRDKVKIKNITRRKFYIYWCFLSFCWIFICWCNREDYLYRKDFDRADAYSILMIVWAVAFLWRFIGFVLNGFDYITKDGIFQPSWKLFIDKKTVEYQQESDSIKIYYAKKRIVNYELSEVSEISELIRDNYILHTEK